MPRLLPTGVFAGAFVIALVAGASCERADAASTRAVKGGTAAVTAGGTLEYGNNAKKVFVSGIGEYEVTFSKSVRNCSYFATPSNPRSGGGTAYSMIATPVVHPSSKKVVVVTIWNTSGKKYAYHGFFLQVVC